MIRKNFIATLFITSFATHSAAIDLTQKYPLAAKYCAAMADRINADRSQIPVDVKPDSQTKFINDMYSMCIAGANEGIAITKEGKSIKRMAEKQADSWSGQQLIHFITGVYNQGLRYGCMAVDLQKDHAEGKDEANALLDGLAAGKN